MEGLSMEVTFMVKYKGQEEVGHRQITPKQRTRALQTVDTAGAKALGGIPVWLEQEGRDMRCDFRSGQGQIMEGFSG